MGHYLAVSAFRCVSAPELSDAISGYLHEHGVSTCLSSLANEAARADAVQVFEPSNGWTTVLWPPHFTLHDVAACRALSRTLDTVVSAMSAPGDAGWFHTLISSGAILDRFASYPASLAWDQSEVEALARKWAGNPAMVAAVFNAPATAVAAHYRQVGPEEPAQDYEEPRRGIRIWWPTDRQDAEMAEPANDGPDPADPWGFVRCWEVLGITYPVGRLEMTARFTMKNGWNRLLPSNPS